MDGYSSKTPGEPGLGKCEEKRRSIVQPHCQPEPRRGCRRERHDRRKQDRPLDSAHIHDERIILAFRGSKRANCRKRRQASVRSLTGRYLALFECLDAKNVAHVRARIDEVADRVGSEYLEEGAESLA